VKNNGGSNARSNSETGRRKLVAKAKHEHRQQEIAAHKAALSAQGITPEFRSEWPVRR